MTNLQKILNEFTSDTHDEIMKAYNEAKNKGYRYILYSQQAYGERCFYEFTAHKTKVTATPRFDCSDSLEYTIPVS